MTKTKAFNGLTIFSGLMLLSLSTVGFWKTVEFSKMVKAEGCDNKLVVWIGVQSALLLSVSAVQFFRVWVDSKSEGVRVCTSASFTSLIVGMVLLYGIDHDSCEQPIYEFGNIWVIFYWVSNSLFFIGCCCMAAFHKN